MREHIRTWTGGDFRLELYDSDRTDWRGQTVLGYEFYHRDALIFEGEDFCGSPMDADDSDASVAALLSFLALKPGDTDREYFEHYTEAQMTFALHHGEELSMYVYDLENPELADANTESL